MKDKVIIKYNNKDGYITYQRGVLFISTILICYDDIVSLKDFDDGLLTAIMKKNDKEIEEYIDFEYALSILGLTDCKKEYFDGISIEDCELIKHDNMKEKIENFKLRQEDIAVAPITINKTKFIEVVLNNSKQKCILTYDTLQLVSSNISSERQIQSIVEKFRKDYAF